MKPNPHDREPPSDLNHDGPRRLYYGWYMVPVATLGLICTGPAQTFGISAFNNSFRESLGLTDTQLTGAYMVGTFLASLPLSWIGTRADRLGLRRSMTIVVLCFGLACIYTALVQNLLMLFLAFFLLRMLGQGALGLLSANTLAFWFDRKLGSVEGVRYFGMAGATVLIPALSLMLISQFGWRWAFAALGVVVWLIMLPLLATVFRNRPAEVGQFIDGASQKEMEQRLLEDTRLNEQHGLTLAQARRTLAFWVFAGSSGVWAMLSTAIFFNIQPLMQDRNMGDPEVKLLYLVFGVVLAFSHLIAGRLADRIALQKLNFASMLLMAVSMALILMMQSSWMVVLVAVVMAFSQALLLAAIGPVWPRFFGRKHLGHIRGFTITIMVASTSVGPFLLGLSKDYLGGFEPMLAAFIAIPLLPAVLTLLARRPEIPAVARDPEPDEADPGALGLGPMDSVALAPEQER